MQVICINAEGYLDSDDLPGGVDGSLIENEEYTIGDSFIHGGYCWYVLEEDMELDGGGYDSRRFENLAQTNSAVKEATLIVNTEVEVI